VRAFDLVIFDLDGTLVDSAPDIVAALNATLVEAGQPALAPQAIMGFVGDGAGKLIERAMVAVSDSGRPLPEHAALLERFLAHYAEHACDTSRLYPGMLELLDGLRAAGATLAVLTNKVEVLARQVLAGLAVLDRFSMVIGDGSGFPRKPDPAAVHHLMAQTGVTPGRTIVIGDGIPDMRVAAAVPCAALAATWGYVPLPRLQAENPRFLAESPLQAATILLSTVASERDSASKR
jgi:phosphoglycolate phosphatase